MRIQNANYDYSMFQLENDRGICARVEWLDDEGLKAARLMAGAGKLAEALALAEGFISGFEDDETQENVPWLLATMRAALHKAGHA